MNLTEIAKQVIEAYERYVSEEQRDGYPDNAYETYCLNAFISAHKMAKAILVMEEALARYEFNHARIPSYCGPDGTLMTGDSVPVFQWAKEALQKAEEIMRGEK